MNDFPKNTKGPGRLLIKTSGNNGGICYPGSSKTMAAWASWVKPSGKLSFKINVKNDKKCEVKEPTSNNDMTCNNLTNLSSNCDKLTVRSGNSSAIVKISQTGYISNIFKSTLVNTDSKYDASSYDGGWFKYGIIYYNVVSWDIVKLYQGNANDINMEMQKKILSLRDFGENIKLSLIGLEDISSLVKICSESGSFTKGNKLITTCTFFLPDSIVDNTGKVSYSEDVNNSSINSRYYIPLKEREHQVSVTVDGLSRLKDIRNDSKDKSKSWFGTWKISNTCKLKVINRFYEPSGDNDTDSNGKLKYKFIYRPIDLSNPFPNRFPGVNWYTWYIVERNKDKKTLEESYKKIEYYTKLDNKTISEIKSYNKDNDYFGEVDSNFFKTYIKEGGQG